ncbi:hypothetical protein BJV74DRAFT_329542 [Russula compacta]|nr:hypothetical protein BJV74DRAFT_329542 [Russula compacta]
MNDCAVGFGLQYCTVLVACMAWCWGSRLFVFTPRSSFVQFQVALLGLCNFYTPSPAATASQSLPCNMAHTHSFNFSSVADLSTTAVSSPATSTEDGSSSDTRFISSGIYTAHSLYTAHHTLSYTYSSTPTFLDQSPTSVPTLGSTSPYDPPPRLSPFHQGHKGLAVIVFVVIGGLIGLVFLALFTRQAIAYSRLPRHNVGMTTAEREQLVREMANYAGRRQRQSCVVPPPPYERAPSYESLSPPRSPH